MVRRTPFYALSVSSPDACVVLVGQSLLEVEAATLAFRYLVRKARSFDKIGFSEMFLITLSNGGLGMRLLLILALLCFTNAVAEAQTGSSFLTTDGVNRAPAAVLHCVTTGNVATPCGTPSQPVVVTGSSGLATATNQLSQIQSDQAIATAAGTPSDAVYSGGSGSLVAILKGLFGLLGSGITAEPVTGIPVSRSISLTASTSTTLFPPNSGRHYLALQAPLSSSVWVNFVGGQAGPNATDCVQLSAGTLYESGQFVTRGAVNVYAPVSVTIAAWEG